jgi:hypothetical protein
MSDAYPVAPAQRSNSNDSVDFPKQPFPQILLPLSDGPTHNGRDSGIQHLVHRLPIASTSSGTESGSKKPEMSETPKQIRSMGPPPSKSNPKEKIKEPEYLRHCIDKIMEAVIPSGRSTANSSKNEQDTHPSSELQASTHHYK